MWNPRDPERAMYVYHARKDDKRTFVDIGKELGISPERVRQMYRRTDWAINRENADHRIKEQQKKKNAKEVSYE